MIAAYLVDESSGPRQRTAVNWRIAVALIIANEIRGLLVAAEVIRLAWN